LERTEVDDGGLLVQRRLEDVVGVHRVLLDERLLARVGP